jgi:hypothetical protein
MFIHISHFIGNSFQQYHIQWHRPNHHKTLMNSWIKLLLNHEIAIMLIGENCSQHKQPKRDMKWLTINNGINNLGWNHHFLNEAWWLYFYHLQIQPNDECAIFSHFKIWMMILANMAFPKSIRLNSLDFGSIMKCFFVCNLYQLPTCHKYEYIALSSTWINLELVGS